MKRKKTTARSDSRKAHEAKTRKLRRLAYKFVRETMPEVWEEMPKEVGLAARPAHSKKRSKKH
jgi:hypothetical protein